MTEVNNINMQRKHVGHSLQKSTSQAATANMRPISSDDTGSIRKRQLDSSSSPGNTYNMGRSGLEILDQEEHNITGN